MKTKKIPFNLERWQKGDFVRVETKKGDVVEQLHLFDVDYRYRLYGVIGDSIMRYTEDGLYCGVTVGHIYDISLIIEDTEQTEAEEEYVWKYVLRSKSEGYVYVNYFEEERNDFFLLEIIKKEKVKLSDL